MTPSDDPDPPQTSSDGPEVIDLRDSIIRPSHLVPSGRPSPLLPNHHLESVTGGDRWVQVEAFVYDIYRRVGYCDESPRQRVEELARWNDRSLLHVVFDSDDEVIGVVRTIFGPYDELPVGQFTRTDFRDSDPVCELSSLTVRTDLRSTGVIEHLYRAGWLEALRRGSAAVVALVDEWLLTVFVDTYHLPFTIIGERRLYMGGEPVPVGLPLAGEHYRPMATTNPDFWDWTLESMTKEEATSWSMPTSIRTPTHPGP